MTNKKNNKINHKTRKISPVKVNQDLPPGIPRKFRNLSSQGDVFLMRVKEIPSDATQIKPTQEDGSYIVAHSESGHHHILEATKPDFLSVFRDVSGRLFAEVREGSSALLWHNKSDKTKHNPIEVPAGSFQIKRAKEYTPQGMRQVAD